VARRELKVRRLLQGNQRGFTLIEMVVVLALIGIIAAGIAMTISQVVAVNSRTSSKMVALRQVQQAGDRVSKDVLQARDVDPNKAGDPFNLDLTIPYWGGDPPSEYSHDVNFTLEDMPGQPGLKQLVRYHTSEPTRIIALYIEPAETSIVPSGDGYVFKVTARVGTQAETREYEVKPRPGS